MADALWMWFKHDAVLLLSLAVIFPIDNRIEYYAFCYKYIFPEFNSKNVNYYSRSYFKIAVQGTREREMIDQWISKTPTVFENDEAIKAKTVIRICHIVQIVDDCIGCPDRRDAISIALETVETGPSNFNYASHNNPLEWQRIHPRHTLPRDHSAELRGEHERHQHSGAVASLVFLVFFFSLLSFFVSAQFPRKIWRLSIFDSTRFRR